MKGKRRMKGEKKGRRKGAFFHNRERGKDDDRKKEPLRTPGDLR